MPIYEYRCGACGYQKEFLQRLSDKPLTKCPECGKRAFNKLVTAAGFQLKGTGWYATDFKNSGAKPAAKQDKKAESKPDKPADGAAKEPSKPAAASGSGGCPASS
ncbi:MAG TPA: zinc ribbon domain-containing protein [Burkholderiales bacterium]|jgi:putative FmdB family regulatory protein